MKRLDAIVSGDRSGAAPVVVLRVRPARPRSLRLLLAIGVALAASLAPCSPAAAEEPAPAVAPGAAAPGSAAAKPAPAPRDPAVIARADALFKEARVLAEQGNLHEACEKFEQSQQLDPSPGTLLNIGNCYEPQGDLVRALATFEQAFIDAQRSTNADRRELWTNAARERIASLSPRVPLISVRGAPPGTRVTLDGQEVEAAKGAMRINPGRHQVEHSAPGKRNGEQSFSIASGQRLAINLPPLEDDVPVAVATNAAPPPPPPVTSSQGRFGVWPWVLGGSGAVLLGTGIVTGIMARSKADELERECDAGVCSSSLEDVRDSGHALATATDILWITGALAAGAGITLFLLDDGAPEAPALEAVEAGCFVGGCGLHASGSF